MIEIGRRLGLELCGVGMPGHFLVGANGSYIDPFHQGAHLTADDARDGSTSAPIRARLRRRLPRARRAARRARPHAGQPGALVRDARAARRGLGAESCDSRSRTSPITSETTANGSSPASRRTRTRPVVDESLDASSSRCSRWGPCCSPTACCRCASSSRATARWLRTASTTTRGSVWCSSSAAAKWAGATRASTSVPSPRSCRPASSPDGRFALATVGTERIDILEWLPDDPYPARGRADACRRRTRARRRARSRRSCRALLAARPRAACATR